MAKISCLAGLCITLLVNSAGARSEDKLTQIEASGKLTVGIRVDTKPFGFRNQKGEMLGFEHDLVADLATRLEAKRGRRNEVDKMTSKARYRLQFLGQSPIVHSMRTVLDSHDMPNVMQ